MQRIVKFFLPTVLLLHVLLVPAPSTAQALHGKLLILTALPQETTEPLRRAFLKLHPEVTVEIRRRGDADSVKLLRAMAGKSSFDLFWSSSPDPFEMLKEDGLLQRYRPDVEALPDHVGATLINDPDGYFTGFSVSGQGFIWNRRYLAAKRLRPPLAWSDLARPEYLGHIGMSSAFRSGATHLAVETLLQNLGWDAGWRLIQRIGGNLRTVARTGDAVARGVREGDFGIGVVMDSYAISARARAYPVAFRYPAGVSFVPASVAILRDAANVDAARAFIDFLLSEEAQYLLLDKRIARLPIRPEIYESAADDFPNPFDAGIINASGTFDIETSIFRYALVNSLFDVMVTFNLASLTEATGLIDRVARRLELVDDEEARKLLEAARQEMAYLPVEEAKSRDRQFVAQFSQERVATDDAVRQRGIELEKRWTRRYRQHYLEAQALARKALARLDRDRGR